MTSSQTMGTFQYAAPCFALLVLVAGQTLALVPGEVLDMTYILDDNTTAWPGAPVEFQQTILVRNATPDMPWLEMNSFTTAEHFGTHLDAPSHAVKGKWRLHEIPIQNFAGPAVRVDVSAQALKNADYQVSVEDLTKWESDNGPIPDGALLFIYTGYGNYWSNPEKYFGYAGVDKDREDGVSLLQFPGISEDAAKWLVKNTAINGVGIDTASLDYGRSLGFESHQIILGNKIFGLENVANVDQLPTKGATVYALPVKMRDGSGSPVRIIAVGGNSVGGAMTMRAGHVAFLFVALLVNAIL